MVSTWRFRFWRRRRWSFVGRRVHGQTKAEKTSRQSQDTKNATSWTALCARFRCCFARRHPGSVRILSDIRDRAFRRNYRSIFPGAEAPHWLRLCRPTSVIAQLDAIYRTILHGAEAPHWLRPCRPTVVLAPSGSGMGALRAHSASIRIVTPVVVVWPIRASHRHP